MSTAATLEERVSALEDLLGQQLAHTITPNYLSANPDGTVGAKFTGAVHAQGLDLDAGVTTTPPDQDKVLWTRTADGAVIAELAAYNNFVGTPPTVSISQQRTIAHIPAADSDPASQSACQLFAIDDAGGPNAFTALSVAVGRTATARSIAVSTPTIGSKILLRDDGASDWLQILSTGKRRLAFGTNFVTFSASAASGITTIAHGLGVVPVVLIPMATQQFGVWWSTFSYTSSSVQLQASYQSALTQTVAFGWIAIG